MQKILELTGYKRALLLIGLGLCVVAALPPIYLFPLAFVGMGGLFLFLDRCETKKQAFLTGWLFGIGFFGGGLYWLNNAFLVNPDKHGWLIPIAVPALAIGVGLFNGLTTLLAHLSWAHRPKDSALIGRILLFASAWTAMEWVRSWLFTGFPWNMMASIWGFSDEILQSTSVFGSFGLSLFSVLATSLSATFFYREGKQKAVVALSVLVIPALLWTSGAIRLMDATVEHHDNVVLRLIQPNIAQKTKWDNDYKIENFNTLLDLSLTPPEGDQFPTHIILPETAVTYAVNREPYVLKALASVTPRGGAVITGTPRMTPRGVQPFQVWNSLVSINEVGSIVASYDKFHLVPFGEYIPLRSWNPIPKLTDGLVDFSPGSGPQTLEITGLPSVSPLICYEIIFPGEVVDPQKRPQWLLNITNDGWYGNSPGPYQHLISAKMRSIEEGLPLVRVANTGVTIITDAYGREQASIPYGVQGFIDVPLAKPLDHIPVFARYGAASWGSILLILIVLGQIMIFLPTKHRSTES